MITTIKLDNNTKERLLKLDIAEKGKSFDIIINELITNYNKGKKEYEKSMNDWKETINNYKRENEKWLKEKDTWDRLLAWAKSKGFK